MEQDTVPLSEIDVEAAAAAGSDSLSRVLSAGAEHFLKNGYLIVRGAFDRSFVARAHDEFLADYRQYFADRLFLDAVQVGDRRTMISLAFRGSFARPHFYANERIMPLLRYFLGPNLIVNALGAVVSLPGAADQAVHKDHPNIYLAPSTKDLDAGWFRNGPPYAITVGIPLVPVTPETGNTRFWPGTHLLNTDRIPRDLGPGVDYTADIGTCVLFDYRVIHTGLANRSDRIRPLVYNIYARSWFRDSVNYIVQDPLLMTAADIREVPKEHRHLFDWVLSADERKAMIGRNDPCMCGSGAKYKHCHGKIES